ncbi:MAG TPA: hypothetical protein PLP05_07230 [Sedimentisphaerales bacterium]|mgnify:CR=1 FL=1|nr:hypothetical protein [Sedimentisphaerales bacterium]
MAKGKKATKKVTTKKAISKGVKGTWTTADLKILNQLFANNPTAKVAQKLNRGLDAVKRKASRMGLKKAKKYMKSLGRG